MKSRAERDPELDIEAVRGISDYWEQVRSQYAAFDSGLQAPSSEVNLHEMPGGQFTNLKAQARSLGLADRWHVIAETCADVNRMFGDVIKVTPSSKVVGDMALETVSQGLIREQVEDPEIDVAFPESVVEMMRGGLGQPPGGIPEKIVREALKGGSQITCRPGRDVPRADLEKTRTWLTEQLEGKSVDDEDLLGYLMYPIVFLDYMGRRRMYGPVRSLPTGTFSFGMEPGGEIAVEIDPGKTLEIRRQAVGETDDNGEVRVFFELNGEPCVIRVPGRKVKSQADAHPKADPADPAHVGAPMPGVVASVAVQPGAAVKRSDLLLTIEAMKTETGIHTDRDAVVRTVHAQPGAQVDAKDLLIEFEA